MAIRPFKHQSGPAGSKVRAHSHLTQLFRAVPMHSELSVPPPSSPPPPLAHIHAAPSTTGPERSYHANHSNPTDSGANLETFCSDKARSHSRFISYAVRRMMFVADRGDKGVTQMYRHVHVGCVCLRSCMSDRAMLKNTSSDSAWAKRALTLVKLSELCESRYG